MLKKKLLIFFLILSVLIPIYFLTKSRNTKEYDYFSADCAIYNRAGKVLFYSKDIYCDYADDGKVLSSDSNLNILKMTDKNNNIIWSSYENTHHDLKFVENQKYFLAITSEVVKYNNRDVRSDCFSKRDLNNKVLLKWCLSDNLEQLQKIGFDFTPILADKPSINELVYPEHEISHANSIYQIEKNTLSSKNPAFEEGNYIINIFAPSLAVIILDKDMKNILWTKNLSRQYYGFNLIKLIVHDVQVTPEGKILAYANSYYERPISLFANFVQLQNFSTPDQFLYPRFNKVDLNWHSSLIKFDPNFNNIQWFYQADPRSKFRSKVLGSVTELKNKNYMYSDITEIKPAVYEVSNDGKIVSKTVLPIGDQPKIYYHIKKAKPMYNPAFLKSRGIIE